MWKEIVVLANSDKHKPSRCIAGREIFTHSGGFDIGPWVRPVSCNGEGELHPRIFTFQDGTTPKIFDLIEVPLITQNTDSSQPENWLISNKFAWKRGAFSNFVEFYNEFIEFPENLWLQPGVKTDRVTKEYISANPPSQSLYLLELYNAKISVNGWKCRIFFIYNGVWYDLSITDPSIFNIIGSESNITLNRCLVCISLAPSFPNQYDGKEYHYKLAAMVTNYD